MRNPIHYDEPYTTDDLEQARAAMLQEDNLDSRGREERERPPGGGVLALVLLVLIFLAYASG